MTFLCRGSCSVFFYILIIFDIAQYCVKIRRGLISVRLSARRNEILQTFSMSTYVCLLFIASFPSFFLSLPSSSFICLMFAPVCSTALLSLPVIHFPSHSIHSNSPRLTFINSISTFRPPPLLSGSVCCHSGLPVCLCPLFISYFCWFYFLKPPLHSLIYNITTHISKFKHCK